LTEEHFNEEQEVDGKIIKRRVPTQKQLMRQIDIKKR
jgi:hypothetical protein